MVPLLCTEGGEKEPQVGLVAPEDGRRSLPVTPALQGVLCSVRKFDPWISEDLQDGVLYA
jgi:hypothetical protein